MVTGFSARTGECPLASDTCVDNSRVPTVLFCGTLEEGVLDSTAQLASQELVQDIRYSWAKQLAGLRTCHCSNEEAGSSVDCP